MKLDFSAQLTPIVNKVKVVGRHHYFIFVVVLLCGLAVAVYVVNQTLASRTDQAYLDQKQLESLKASFDDATIEKIENLQKSNESSTAPPPSGSARTNPFAE